MDKQTEFFMYLVECYAGSRGQPTAEVLREWDEHGITQEIFDNYDQYRTERIENAHADIDSLVATGKHLGSEPGHASATFVLPNTRRQNHERRAICSAHQ